MTAITRTSYGDLVLSDMDGNGAQLTVTDQQDQRTLSISIELPTTAGTVSLEVRLDAGAPDTLQAEIKSIREKGQF